LHPFFYSLSLSVFSDGREEENIKWNLLPDIERKRVVGGD
jgi:hypothetical protein